MVVGAAFGDPCGCDAHPLGRVARAWRTGWGEEWRICLDEEPVHRDERGDVGRCFLPGPEHEAREADRKAEVDDLAGVVDGGPRTSG